MLSEEKKTLCEWTCYCLADDCYRCPLNDDDTLYTGYEAIIKLEVINNES